jgi:hypothetical protein
MKYSELKIGDTFHRLTFKNLTENHIVPSGKKLMKALWSCSCGKEKEIIVRSVLKGNTKSCGCLNAEVHRDILKTHGDSYTKFYKIWQCMHGRVSCERGSARVNYKDKGITVCERWSSYENFKEDMFESYNEGDSLDRINNSMGYFKENCRWTNINVQNYNRSQPAKPSKTGKTGVKFREDRGVFEASITKQGVIKTKHFAYMIDAIFQRMQWEQELYGFCKT